MDCLVLQDDNNNKLVAYGVGFRTQKYTHDDGKEARKLVILGTNSNALVLGKGSIKVTSNDSAAIQAKDKLKKNCTYLIKNCFVCEL